MGCAVLHTSQGSQDSWSVSPEWSASLALAIVSVTRVLGLLDGPSLFLCVDIELKRKIRALCRLQHRNRLLYDIVGTGSGEIIQTPESIGSGP